MINCVSSVDAKFLEFFNEDVLEVVYNATHELKFYVFYEAENLIIPSLCQLGLDKKSNKINFYVVEDYNPGPLKRLIYHPLGIYPYWIGSLDDIELKVTNHLMNVLLCISIQMHNTKYINDLWIIFITNKADDLEDKLYEIKDKYTDSINLQDDTLISGSDNSSDNDSVDKYNNYVEDSYPYVPLNSDNSDSESEHINEVLDSDNKENIMEYMENYL